MKPLINYVDDLKNKYGSDNKAAKALNIARESISKIRSRGQMADETAIKIADALEIERDEILIAAAIARSDGEVKKAWMNMSKHMGIAASIALASTLNLINTSAGDDLDSIHSTAKTVYYVKL